MIGNVLDMLLGPLGALVAGIVALLAAWAKGKRDGRMTAEKRALEEYQRTRRAIDEAADDLPDDPAVLRDWLRERGKH